MNKDELKVGMVIVSSKEKLERTIVAVTDEWIICKIKNGRELAMLIYNLEDDGWEISKEKKKKKIKLYRYTCELKNNIEQSPWTTSNIIVTEIDGIQKILKTEEKEVEIDDE